MTSGRRSLEVLVVGAGMAGLVAAWQAACAGAGTRVVSAGWGALYWHAGCVDVLGYHPPDRLVESPAEALGRLGSAHPYTRAGQEALEQALSALAELCRRAGYPLEGSLDQNWLLPSALGAARPTCLAPATMTAGDLRRRDPMVLVGLEGFADFHPGLVAANLAEQGVPARGVVLDLPELRDRRSVTASVLAGLFDDRSFRERVADALAHRVGRASRVGFPAVLGLADASTAVAHLGDRLGTEVFEVPTLPPSVPGMRLHRILVEAVEAAGGQVFTGMEAVAADRASGSGAGRMTTVWTEAAARRQAHRAAAFVLATGGILGGGIVADQEGSLREVVMGLPVEGPLSRDGWFHRDFLGPEGHPVYRAGLPVDELFRPIDGGAAWQNVLVAGAALTGCDQLRERSLEGVALVTGYLAGGRAAELGMS